MHQKTQFTSLEQSNLHRPVFLLPKLDHLLISRRLEPSSTQPSLLSLLLPILTSHQNLKQQYLAFFATRTRPNHPRSNSTFPTSQLISIMAPVEKKWDDSAERDLCVAIIQANQDGAKKTYNWPRVEEIMTTLGHTFTKDAMSYV